MKTFIKRSAVIDPHIVRQQVKKPVSEFGLKVRDHGRVMSGFGQEKVKPKQKN